MGRFLSELITWLQNRRDSDAKVNRSGNAMAVLRESGIFCGAGVYTANEIWHCAGTFVLLLS